MSNPNLETIDRRAFLGGLMLGVKRTAASFLFSFRPGSGCHGSKMGAKEWARIRFHLSADYES